MKLEILAPAGNAECAKAAINAGADAIYLGYSEFSARQSAENFDDEGLLETVQNAHICGAKVYVAMNTVVKDGETENFLRTLLSVWRLGVDAVILQDALLGRFIHERYPQIVLHLSTQAGVCNVEGAEFAKKCGFSRVILARETPLEELGRIASLIETEAFVQGALCTCFSGQCYFSSFIGGNSGNRGRCKQPCRKTYTYDRAGFEERAYALSLSDLCVGEDIEKYIAAGVVSFKIEGRMRRAEYVSAAVAYYRSLLDKSLNAESRKEAALSDLKRTYNRGNYTKGLAFGQDKRLLSTTVQGHIGEKVGVIKVVNGKYFVESRFRARSGDAFKILRAGKEVGGASFEKSDGKGFIVFFNARLKNGDGVFVTTDTALSERLLAKEKRGRIELELYFEENGYARVLGGGVEVCSEEILQSAASRPLTEEELKSCFLKTDGLPVDILFKTVHIKGNIFIPKSRLNALRRAFYDKVRQNATRSACIDCGYLPKVQADLRGTNGKIAVIATDFENVTADIAVCKPNDYGKPLPSSFINGNFEKYLYYPAFCTREDILAMEKWCESGEIDGVYAENYGGIVFADKKGLSVFAGTGLNLFNAVSLSELLKERSVRYYAVSKEATTLESRGLSGEKAFVLGVGDIKLMDLCYCPFGKSCGSCDKKAVYKLTDENGRVFPVRRYVGADGKCRFEVYNCASLVSAPVKGAGGLLDLTLAKNKAELIAAANDTEKQKNILKQYTSGHALRGVL